MRPAGSARMRRLLLAGPVVAAVACMAISYPTAAEEESESALTNWGRHHAGQSFPEYVTGDECLFCHRKKVGPAWSSNVHQRTLRRMGSGNRLSEQLKNKTGEQADFLLGSSRHTRFLRRSQQYGKLDLLTSVYGDEHGLLRETKRATWDPEKFAKRCAGCHSTAVDAETNSFAATSLDCFTCHGDVGLLHANDASHVFLSKTNRKPRQVISTCGQCHLRGGQSRSTSRPWPNTFIAGDNLFHDFDVDLSDQAIQRLPAIEQHIFLNCREVGTGRETAHTCISCHEVHGQSSEKHTGLEAAGICLTCHVPDTGHSELREDVRSSNLLEKHSQTCEY